MNKFLVLLFTITLGLQVQAKSNCAIGSFSFIYKINKVQDDTVIQRSNCSKKINFAFVELISSAQGKLNASYLQHYFQSEFQESVSFTPKTIVVKTIKELLEDHFQDEKITFSNITSLYGKASLNFQQKPHFSLNCKECSKSGKKNINLKANKQNYWLTLDLLKKRKAYKMALPTYAYKTNLDKSYLKETIISDYGKDQLFSDIKNIKFYQTNKSLSPGDILKSRDLNPRTLVKYGKKVKIIVKNGNINLRMLGIARGNGTHGQVIDVYNPKSKKILNAKVIDINTTVLEL